MCIGGTNYNEFLTLLASFILYCLSSVILTWIQENSWIKMLELLVTMLLMCLTMVLFGFHFYLNKVLGKSTFEYLIMGDEK